MRIFNVISVIIIFVGFSLGIFLSVFSCSEKQTVFYRADDFERIPKIDAHFHYDTPDEYYLKFTDSLNFRLLSPNVDAGESIEKQLEIASALKKRHPGKLAFFGTFAVDRFGSPDFAEQVIAQIDRSMKGGASGIKIWKNIGMELKDSAGRYIMADDPAFDPVFRYLETNRIPVIAHLGEPRNCWLPESEMTLDNDRRYFKNHPQYHMYVHPEAPSYEDQLAARDNLLKKYPALKMIGAHLGSMEWSVDELVARLDRFPNLDVDMAARIGHLQYQAIADREKVRNFMVNYQNRILYATDASVHGNGTNFSMVSEGLRNRWFEQWLFLATDSIIPVNDLGGQKVKGLQLPQEVIDKLYYKNAEKYFTN